MIITNVRRTTVEGSSAIGWGGLRRFRNPGLTAAIIEKLQHPPAGQAKNVRKQAEQLRDCLLQAEEYFAAGRSVGLATKPVLIYYGMMSLALMEILFKGTGDVSLDRARGQHAHHGLDFRITGNPVALASLTDSASALRAVPAIKGGKSRFGTFELWHRLARETPLAAKILVTRPEVTQETLAIVADVTDKRMSLLDDSGISLLDCFRSVPGMRPLLSDLNVESSLCRARMTGTWNVPSDKRSLTITFQPGNKDALEVFAEKYVHPFSNRTDVVVKRMLETYSITIDRHPDQQTSAYSLPNSFQSDATEAFFCSNNEMLNEFGLYYVASFILGNYARYYPDYWMREVDQGTELAQSAENIIQIIEQRAPMLMYSEFTQKASIVF